MKTALHVVRGLSPLPPDGGTFPSNTPGTPARRGGT